MLTWRHQRLTRTVRVRQIKPTRVGFRAPVKIASRIVSYRTPVRYDIRFLNEANLQSLMSATALFGLSFFGVARAAGLAGNQRPVCSSNPSASRCYATWKAAR